MSDDLRDRIAEAIYPGTPEAAHFTDELISKIADAIMPLVEEEIRLRMAVAWDQGEEAGQCNESGWQITNPYRADEIEAGS